MKHFCFYVQKASKRGYTHTALIYKIVNNKPEYIGTTSWNTASYRGNIHEVYNKLINLGYIPCKYYNSSVNEWRGAGYYGGDVVNKYKITEL